MEVAPMVLDLELKAKVRLSVDPYIGSLSDFVSLIPFLFSAIGYGSFTEGQAECFWSLAVWTGCYLLIAGHWPLIAGCSLVVYRWLLLLVGRWSLVGGCWSLAAGSYSLVAGCWTILADPQSQVFGSIRLKC